MCPNTPVHAPSCTIRVRACGDSLHILHPNIENERPVCAPFPLNIENERLIFTIRLLSIEHHRPNITLRALNVEVRTLRDELAHGGPDRSRILRSENQRASASIAITVIAAIVIIVIVLTIAAGVGASGRDVGHLVFAIVG